MENEYVRSHELPVICAWIGRFFFWLLGWRAEGAVPNIPRFVVIGAPHTSNTDGLLLLGLSLVFRVRPRWIGKHTLFKPWPVGVLLRALGGIAVDRTARHNTVDQIIMEFPKHRQMMLVIAPEGTRKKTDSWKTGFYRIAHGAQVPIQLAYIDYAHKSAGLGPVIYPSGDIEADMPFIQEYYADKVGRHPERMSRVGLPSKDGG